MGIVSHLFYASDQDLQTLHRRIVPSEEQKEDQKQYWNDLADYLKERLTAATGCGVSSWLQGSYKFGTQIRPHRKGLEFDIDLGVYFASGGPCANSPYSAAELKDLIQTALVAYADSPDTDALNATDPKEFCSRIVFGNAFHIDVPAYHECGEDRRLASASSGFIESDPVPIYEWWVAQFSDADRDRARRMVRYLKMWAALKFDPKTVAPPSSIMLTVLVGEALHGMDLSAYPGDDDLLEKLVHALVERMNADASVPNPANKSEDLNRLKGDTQNFLAELAKLLSVCNRAQVAEDIGTATDVWSEAFDHMFPLPAVDELTELSKAIVPAFQPEIEVVVTLAGGKTLSSRNQAFNIPYGAKLQFRLLNYTQLPAGSFVRWIVRNEGAEAESENDLGHFSGNGDAVLEEAVYRGRHYMDVTISNFAGTIGRRRIPVSILKETLGQRGKRLFKNRRR